MPRDKKTIHRATSDVEDEFISDEEPIKQEEKHVEIEDSDNLIEKRKQYLKSAILKRSLALKQQKEYYRQQRVEVTNKNK
jgi:hypothetical protein